jgi:acyl-ACP thioesterase
MAVKYSDMDLNNHVNNAAYARWMLDSYPLDFHRSHRVRSLAINFLGELDGNDSFEMVTETEEPRFSHTIRRHIDGAEACRAQIEWMPLR